jgi:hypothetical protein
LEPVALGGWLDQTKDMTMLRSLGVMTAFKWFCVAAVAVAIWRGFNGDLGAIISTVWLWIQRGADVVTNIWNSINS